MARRTKLLGHVSYIHINGEPAVKLDELSPEKRSECIRKMMDNAGKAASSYYSRNPEEYKEFLKGKI